VEPAQLRQQGLLAFAGGELWFALQADGVVNIGWQPRQDETAVH
jgi:hypothetical protein